MMRRSLGMLERVVVYGGNGGLGQAVVAHLAAQKWQTISVDFGANSAASANVVLDPQAALEATSSRVRGEVAAALGGQKLDAVINLAGGWAGGGIEAEDILASSDLMWRQSVHSSLVCGQLAASDLSEGGLLVLPGAAAAAAGGTAGMLSYGTAKAAVHHIIASLAQEGLPGKAAVLGVLPVTLDTPMNRKFMPDADHTTWTPLPFVAELMEKWVTAPASRPASGTLVRFDTQGGKTSLVAMDVSVTDRVI